MSVFDAALFKLLFDFAKSNGGSPPGYSPIESAIVNNKQFVAVSVVATGGYMGIFIKNLIEKKLFLIDVVNKMQRVHPFCVLLYFLYIF